MINMKITATIPLIFFEKYPPPLPSILPPRLLHHDPRTFPPRLLLLSILALTTEGVTAVLLLVTVTVLLICGGGTAEGGRFVPLVPVLHSELIDGALDLFLSRHVTVTGVSIGDRILLCVIAIVRCLFEDGNERPGLRLDLCLRLRLCLLRGCG
jgi:hypothetical protein